MRFDDDCDAFEDARAVQHADERSRRERLYAFLRMGRKLYPYNRALRKKWVRARLLMGSLEPKPKVKLGVGNGAVAPRFPRTMREAGFAEGLS